MRIRDRLQFVMFSVKGIAPLDLSYVDNWSMASENTIVAKALKAMLGSDGAN